MLTARHLPAAAVPRHQPEEAGSFGSPGYPVGRPCPRSAPTRTVGPDDGKVPLRPPDAPRVPDHRADRARRGRPEPLYGGDRDRDAATDRVLPGGRILHLPDLARTAGGDREVVGPRARGGVSVRPRRSGPPRGAPFGPAPPGGGGPPSPPPRPRGGARGSR